MPATIGNGAARLGGLLALLLALVACDRSNDNDRAGTDSIRLQAVADAVEAKAYQRLIDGFLRDNPGAQIQLQTVGRQRDHVTRLATGFAAGEPPDLFLINYRRYGQFLGKGLLTPLGPRLQALGAFAPADFYSPSMEAFREGGEQLCMPQNISTLVVYWNRALFQRFKVPEPASDWTWRDFMATAQALTRDSDGDGEKDIFGFDMDPSLVRLAPFIWQAGGRVVDDLERPTRLAFEDSRGALQGLLFPKILRVEQGVMPPLAQRRALGPDARFAQGKLGMTLQSRRFTTTLRAVEGLDWDVAPLPRQRQAATVLHADAYCLSAASDNPDLATRFVAFASSPAGQSLLAQTGRIVPSRRAVAESPAFLDPEQPPASARVFLDNVEIVRRLPVSPTWYEIEMRSHPIIEEWLFETNPMSSAELKSGLVEAQRLSRLLSEATASLFPGGD